MVFGLVINLHEVQSENLFTSTLLNVPPISQSSISVCSIFASIPSNGLLVLYRKHTKISIITFQTDWQFALFNHTSYFCYILQK